MSTESLNLITEITEVAGIETRSIAELIEDDSGLEILVDLAKKGEINPWDVDLELATEKFLKAISETKEENLREAGRAIFYASVLLRMKSDILSSQADAALHYSAEDDFDDLLQEELEFDNNKQVSFRDLERVLRRRSVQKAKRFRKLTLEDLLGALKNAREEEEQRTVRRNQQNLLGDLFDYEVVEPEISEDISELTHAENLEEAIQRARVFVAEYLINEKGVSFDELVKYLGSWSNAFLSVIFLAHESEVDLEQQKLYGDLLIYEPKS